MQLCKTYYDVKNSTKRIDINQGGTRSGKTYSILQLLVEYCFSNPDSNAIITICRDTMPSLRGSAMRDFFKILQDCGYYREENHFKSLDEYLLFGNLIEFIGCDQPQKIRGRKRTILFCNEANEFKYDAFMQLLMRTTGKVILDYNPSDEYHWIYEKLIPRSDASFHRTTYLDNPYLDELIVKEIERLKDEDENYWRIYGLGERGISTEKIYTNWEIAKEWPEDFDEVVYGLDFGYVNPTALIEVGYKDQNVYLKQLLYESYLTNDILGIKLIDMMNKNTYCFADCAEPDKIEELRRNGFLVVEADKSVHDGIDYCKRGKMYVHPESSNLIKELKSYSWKKDPKTNEIRDKEPVKIHDHLLDAMRYARWTYYKLTNNEVTAEFL